MPVKRGRLSGQKGGDGAIHLQFDDGGRCGRVGVILPPFYRVIDLLTDGGKDLVKSSRRLFS